MAAGPLCPKAWGSRPCSGRLVPVGGGNGGHLEITVSFISTSLLESFPTDLLEMEEDQDSRHFQMSNAISTEV